MKNKYSLHTKEFACISSFTEDDCNNNIECVYNTTTKLCDTKV